MYAEACTFPGKVGECSKTLLPALQRQKEEAFKGKHATLMTPERLYCIYLLHQTKTNARAIKKKKKNLLPYMAEDQHQLVSLPRPD